MMVFLRIVVSIGIVLFSSISFACTGGDCAASLAYQAYGATDKPKAIVVFLHGAVSAGGPADYMYRHARRFAETHPDIVAIALLAPGYYDRQGKQSDGSDSRRRLADDTEELIPALKALQNKYQAQNIYVLGHSRGAMNLGGILGKEPGLISGAVLVAGPYDMFALATYRNRPQNGIQVIDLVPKIDKDTKIVLVHGDADRDVPISQSITLDEKARARGLASQLITLPGEGHNFGGVVASTATTQLGKLVD